MTTLLRETNTGLFSRGPDQWTDDPFHAVDFRFSDRAVHYAKAWSLQNVELAFLFDEPHPVTAMPMEQVLRYWHYDELTGSD